jgi:hypothetical protein
MCIYKVKTTSDKAGMEGLGWGELVPLLRPLAPSFFLFPLFFHLLRPPLSTLFFQWSSGLWERLEPPSPTATSVTEDDIQFGLIGVFAYFSSLW